NGTGWVCWTSIWPWYGVRFRICGPWTVLFEVRPAPPTSPTPWLYRRLPNWREGIPLVPWRRCSNGWRRGRTSMRRCWPPPASQCPDLTLSGGAPSAGGTAWQPGSWPGADGDCSPCRCGPWSGFAGAPICPGGLRSTRAGRFRPKPPALLNLTELRNRSSLNPYVEPTPFRASAPFRACFAEPRYPRGGGAGAGGRLSDPAGWSSQCGSGASGLWILRAVPDRYRVLASVGHHGTVPAISLKTKVGPRSRANSSAGSERLPYTQDVGGSNPSSPMYTRAEPRN